MASFLSQSRNREDRTALIIHFLGGSGHGKRHLRAYARQHCRGDVQRIDGLVAMAFESETAQAQHHIEEARRLVARQRQIVKSLRDDGHDTVSAEGLLKRMLETLKAFEKDQQTLEDERYAGH
jgi:hypothetical protein